MIGMAYTGYRLVQTQQHLAAMQSELAKRDAQTKEQVARLFASFNSELEKANAQCASVPTQKAETQSPPSSPGTWVVPPAPMYYVVRDASGNCAVVDFQPSADSDLKTIERSDYRQCNAVIDGKALTARSSNK